MGLELDLEGGQHNRSVGRRKMSILREPPARSARSNLIESDRLRIYLLSWEMEIEKGWRKE